MSDPTLPRTLGTALFCVLASVGLAQAQTLSREYVYLGERLIAVEHASSSAGPRHATEVNLTAPSVVEAGQTFAATVTMRNAGTLTWTNGGTQPYKLGSSAPDNTARWTVNRVMLPTATVAPGATATFAFSPVAPGTAGAHDFAWRMVQENVGFFGDVANQSLRVVAAPAGAAHPRDHNADDRGDLVLQNPGSGAGTVWTMRVAQVLSVVPLNDGAPGWRVVPAGDLNGDGDADLVWQDDASGECWAKFLQGTTVIDDPVRLSAGDSGRVVGAGDFNNDGQQDLVLQVPRRSDGTRGDVWVWFLASGGAAVASYANIHPATDWTVPGVGDYNHDGKGDLLMRSPNGSLHVRLMNGLQVLDDPLVWPATVWMPRAAELTHDGQSDLVWQAAHGNGEMWLHAMDGISLMGAAQITPGTTLRVR